MNLEMWSMIAARSLRSVLRQGAYAPLAVVLGLLLSVGVPAQTHAQGKSATEKAAGPSLDNITRAVQEKYGRVLAISQTADGRVKAKVLTADGRVRYLDLDPERL